MSANFDPKDVYEKILAHIEPLREFVETNTPLWYATDTSTEDIYQETLARAVLGLEGLTATDPEKVFGWLKKIAENTLIDAMRKSHRLKRGGGLKVQHIGSKGSRIVDRAYFVSRMSSGKTPSRVAASNEAAAFIHQAVDGLPPDQREAIRLRYYEGCSPDSVAERMQKTPEATRGLIFRGLRSVKNLVRQTGDFFSSAPGRRKPGKSGSDSDDAGQST